MQNTPFIVIYHLYEFTYRLEVRYMNHSAMNIVIRGVAMPHFGDRNWARKVVQLAEARERGVDAYNMYLRNHHAKTGSAAMSV